jgi:glycosyltransferase involved in cell wall biosynthesis
MLDATGIRFTFAIPLIGCAVARDWSKVQTNLANTLKSLLAQTDPRVEILLLGTDRPNTIPDDPRVSWIDVAVGGMASWRGALEDAGSKREFAAWECGRRGGGYLMFVDAADLVSRHLVAYVRQTRHPHGYVLRSGYLHRVADRSLSKIGPDGKGQLDFSQVCGTSVILNLSPHDYGDIGNSSPTRYQKLFRDGHVGFVAALEEEGLAAHEVPFPAAVYVTQTGDNISITGAAPESDERRRQLDLEVERSGACLIPVSCHHIADFALDLKPEEQTNVKLSICVVTYRNPHGLARLIKALEPSLCETDSELIVVNDGSDSDEYRSLITAHDRSIAYVPLPRNLGIPGARNAAAEAARGEWIVYIDDDCLPPEEWLSWLQARLRASPDVDVVGGTTTPLEPRRPTLLSTAQRLFGYYPQPRLFDGSLLFVTANLAIRRDCLMQVGGFAASEEFAGAGEDTELSVRLQHSGYRVAIDFGWVTAHDVGDGLRRNLRRFWRYGLGNGQYAHSPHAPSALDEHFRFMRNSLLKEFKTALCRNIRTATTSGLSMPRAVAVGAIGATLHAAYVLGWRRGFTLSLQRRERRQVQA